MDTKALAQKLLQILESMKRTGIRDPQEELVRSDYMVLQYLSGKNNITPTELRKELNVTASRITTIIKGLEKKQLVTRGADSTDLRKFVINLSKEGEEYLYKQKKLQLIAITDMMQYLGEDDAKEYIRIMEKLSKRE